MTLADDFLEDLRRTIRVAVIAVPHSHLFERNVTIGFTRVPMQPLPFVANDFAHRIAWRQSYPNSVAPFKPGRFRVDEVVQMAIVHGAEVYRNISFGHPCPPLPRGLTSQAGVALRTSTQVSRST